MKEYFPHDFTARTDRKLVNLQRKYGMAGIGIYWCMVEIIYENGGFISEEECESIAYEIRTKYERIISVLRDFELFYFKEGFYRSHSIDRRLEIRTNKSELAKKSINARWERIRNQEVNTNVLRTNYECNTIKEKKSKENKKVKEGFVVIDPSFEIAWNLWKQYRYESKKPIKPMSEKFAYKKLCKLSNGNPDEALEIVEHSIANGYQGLFADQKNGNKPDKPTKPTKLDF